MIERQRYSGGELGRNERGSTLVLVTLFIFVLFGFTALSIDVANVYREKHKAHDATDAGALAGVAKLGDSSVLPGTQASDAINEAEVIANTNGVKHAEITSSNTGTIQVGSWDGTAFTANSTPYNAVRVPAQRTVPLNFGKVVGFSQMTPFVDSIATIGAQAMQYGVPHDAVDGVAINGTVTLQKWQNVSGGGGGNWGPIELCNVFNGKGATITALTGGGCFATVGLQVNTSPGNDGVDLAFQQLCAQAATVVMPVTTTFPGGSHTVTILDFIVVKLTDSSCGSGNGTGWTFQATLLGRGFSDLKRLGFGPVRTLVE